MRTNNDRKEQSSGFRACRYFVQAVTTTSELADASCRQQQRLRSIAWAVMEAGATGWEREITSGFGAKAFTLERRWRRIASMEAETTKNEWRNGRGRGPLSPSWPSPYMAGIRTIPSEVGQSVSVNTLGRAVNIQELLYWTLNYPGIQTNTHQ